MAGCHVETSVCVCKVRSPLPGVWLPEKVHACAHTTAYVSFPSNKYVHFIHISGRKLPAGLCLVYIYVFICAI